MPIQHLPRLPYGRLVIRALDRPDRDELLAHMPNRIDAVLRHDTSAHIGWLIAGVSRAQGLSGSEHNRNQLCPLKRLNFGLLPRCITFKDPAGRFSRGAGSKRKSLTANILKIAWHRFKVWTLLECSSLLPAEQTHETDHDRHPARLVARPEGK
jgi:hypothetical protein